MTLAQSGANTALIGRRAPYADNRTTALLGGSVDLMQQLDVWPLCMDKAAALLAMRLVDDTGRLVRAPEVKFSSDEIGLDQFGYNIENRALMMALEQRAAELSNLMRIDDDAEAVHPERPRLLFVRGKAGPFSAPGGWRRRAAIALPRGRWHRGPAPQP